MPPTHHEQDRDRDQPDKHERPRAREARHQAGGEQHSPRRVAARKRRVERQNMNSRVWCLTFVIHDKSSTHTFSLKRPGAGAAVP